MSTAEEFMKTHLGENLNTQTLTPFAIQEMMMEYAMGHVQDFKNTLLKKCVESDLNGSGVQEVVTNFIIEENYHCQLQKIK